MKARNIFRIPILNLFIVSCVTMITNSETLAPTIYTDSTTVRVQKGSAAVLKCRVQHINSHQVSWTFVTHDLTIYKGRELLTNDPGKYSIISPLDTQSYNLMLLSPEQSDHGYYRCAIDGTDKSVTILLEVEGKVQVPFNPPPLNRTDCCIHEGVSESCLPSCFPSSLDMNTSSLIDNCNNTEDTTYMTNLQGLTKCLTANSNHDNCCLFRGLHPMCLPFCHNEIPANLSFDHLDNCLVNESVEIMFQCFTLGFESLPTEPRDVTVLPSTTNEASSLLISWKPPNRNADKVTGYKIMFKKENEDTYFSHMINNPMVNKYRLTGPRIIPDMGYYVHVAALANEGVSMGSVDILEFIPDPSLSETQNQLISDCCLDRKVSSVCNSLLCRSRTWAHFNYNSIAQCFPYMKDVFTCLVGERDHTSCCDTFGVTPFCQPLCSGNPPPFNESLVICTQQLGTIEACVQQGYDKLPAPPYNLTLDEVTSRTATILFKKPSSSLKINQYIVELHEGNDEERTFNPNMTLTGESEFLVLNSLSPNTYYGVRIITEATVGSSVFGSLPSETVFFLTYPASFDEPTVAPVVNVPHDLKACCESKQMPQICSDGCQYVANMTAYYKPIIDKCYSHIGTVLSCAADGRDHSTCCLQNGMTNPSCLHLCTLTTNGPLPSNVASSCLQATPIAIQCYQEGIVNLPRHPDVVVSNITWNSISLEWVQPSTSSRIETYIVNYGIYSQDQRIQKRTEKTHIILNNLSPGTAYTIAVFSENANGTSVPSPAITQYTLREKIDFPNFNDSSARGIELWSNNSHCCTEIGIPAHCVGLCLNKQIQNPDPSCAQYSTKLLTCYLDGLDLSGCCSKKTELPPACYAICSGQAQGQSPQLDSCLSYGNRAVILSCFLENSALVPGVPRRMIVREKNGTQVQIDWLKPDSFCGDDCKSVILYWKWTLDKTDERVVMTIKNAESPHVIDGLDTEYFYTFVVRAENSHGGGPLSNQETLFLSAYSRQVMVRLRSNQPYVEKGQDATLDCAAFGFNPDDPYKLQWFFNNGREIIPAGTNKNVLLLQNVDPIKDEGTYSCVVTDSTEINSFDFFLPIKYTPKGSQTRDDTVSPGNGDAAILACWFNGLPDTDADQWQKDGMPLPDDAVKYSASVDRRYHTGITSYRLRILNVVTADFGSYSMKVANKFGHTYCTVKIQDPKDITNILPAQKVFNGTDCCAKQGVPELCQPLCGFDIDIEEIIEDSSYITCLAYFDIFIKCGADGRDHTTCCKNTGIIPYCLPYCAGQVPGSVITDQEEMLQCISDSTQIFGCMQKGHKLIPFPPRNVIASWWASGKTIMVRWSKPLHNHNRIDHYYIHFKPGGNGPMQIHIVNEQIQEYEIKIVDQMKDYSVSVSAGNKWGTSHNSEITILEAITLPAPAFLNVKVTGTDVTISWDNSPASSTNFDSYNVIYRKSNTGSFKRNSDITNSFYKLSGLMEDTQYTVYVTTTARRGHESAPSVHKNFMTGVKIKDPSPSGQSDDDSDSKVAIGIGVVVALFAVAAIIFLVIYLMKNRRIHKLNNDAVTFENPGYGNQGSVKIEGVGTDEQFNYGRLDEERVYDNPTPTESPAGEKPANYDRLTFAGEGNTDSNIATLPVESSET